MVFTIVDLETTGLSKNYHKITEIAAVKVKNNRIADSYHTLVNPEVRIPSFITRLTGIDNEMVKDSPKIKHVLPGFVDFLKDDVFVAHNAGFDFGFLNHNLKTHYDKDLRNDVLCTRKLANRLYPALERKRLCDLCDHFNIKNDESHRAMGDVRATAKVFANMLKDLEDKNIRDVDEILRYQKKPRPRV